jgi:hypothetical protein
MIWTPRSYEDPPFVVQVTHHHPLFLKPRVPGSIIRKSELYMIEREGGGAMSEPTSKGS